MEKHDHKDDRTLQDDREALEVDAEDESPLVAGEGAPLSEDTVPPDADEDVVVTQGILGGAPVAFLPHGEDPPPHDPMAARDDRPIGD
jgi:hypothetical protein